jgi:hypothetical protein
MGRGKGRGRRRGVEAQEGGRAKGRVEEVLD